MPVLPFTEVAGRRVAVPYLNLYVGNGFVLVPTCRHQADADMLTIIGAAFPQRVPAPQSSAMLSRVIANNGIVAENVAGLEIFRLDAKEFAGFPILIVGGSHARIHDVRLTDSGSLDVAGHNNGTGGLVLEEGATDFEVSNALFGKVRGNGIWIRSTGATASKGRITAPNGTKPLRTTSGKSRQLTGRSRPW